MRRSAPAVRPELPPTPESATHRQIAEFNEKGPRQTPALLAHVILRGHEGWGVSAVAISPDNRWLVTGSDDKTARLWLFQMNDLIHLARVTVGRNFSADEWRLYFPGEPYRKTFLDLPGPD